MASLLMPRLQLRRNDSRSSSMLHASHDRRPQIFILAIQVVHCGIWLGSIPTSTLSAESICHIRANEQYIRASDSSREDRARLLRKSDGQSRYPSKLSGFSQWQQRLPTDRERGEGLSFLVPKYTASDQD